MSQVNQTRKVAERIVVIGRLMLQSPAHLGNGDVSFFTDSPIFRDMDGQPVLSGATLAGALRAYLSRIDSQLASELFGYVTGANSANGPIALETALLVNDARAEAAPVEFRDGVAISPKTRTAEQKKKFDLELLAADVAFDVHLELAPGPQDRSDLDQLKRGFVTVLKALEDGHIPLGKRKTRGFGECKVVEWRAQIFDLAQPRHLLDWLKWDGRPETLALKGTSIEALLNVEALPNTTQPLRLQAEFELDGSLLIRAQDPDAVVDMMHLRSRRQNSNQPVLSGTSLAGALRARAQRIANTLCPDRDRAKQFVDAMFGPRAPEGENLRQGELRASRVSVRETVIRNAVGDLVQSRVRIDRFTGGAFPAALFSQNPLFGKPGARVRVDISLAQPRPESPDAAPQPAIKQSEIGLLLLLLKDLWTGDLPLGGESSVGRGRLKGVQAAISGPHGVWEIRAEKDALKFNDPQAKAAMEACVAAFYQEMTAS